VIEISVVVLQVGYAQVSITLRSFAIPRRASEGCAGANEGFRKI
jgi:hypothetical protein